MSRVRVSKSQVVWCVTAGVLLCVHAASADFVMGQPELLGAPFNSPADDWSMSVSADGLQTFFSSARPGGYGSDDLWMVTRDAVDEPWGEPVNLGPSVNTSASEGYPSISADGLTLFFSEMFASTIARPLRPGGMGGQDLWMVTRPSAESEWGTPTNLGSVVNSTADERSPCISSDGLSLYLASNRPGGSGTLDLWVSTRPDTDSPWTAPVNLGPAINSGDDDADPSLSADGLTLFFASWGRPGGSGSHDLYVATRNSVMDTWRSAVNLGPSVNSSSGDGCPCFWAGGPTLFFISYRSGGPGGFDFRQLPITPVLDFSGDGKIDGREVAIMAELWGQDELVADIAPPPFGDGTVDARDLLVLAGYIGSPLNDPTLVAHWALDETEGMVASDSVGGHDGIVVGVPAWQPTGGAVDGALECDGTTVVVADFVFDPSEGPLGVLAWVKGGAPGQGIVSQQAGANWLALDPATGALTTELKSGSRQSYPLSSDVGIADDDWHRLAFAWDGSVRRLYVDDVLVAEESDVALAGCDGGLRIGCGKFMSPGTFFTGLIDDVRIYSRAVKP
ncbi:MAG: PD40 domain-containing protein [Sedimentisphaerales bacterium]|nr:PD40 domain-containing protein [Sedimentisphaerales bacterium]